MHYDFSLQAPAQASGVLLPHSSWPPTFSHEVGRRQAAPGHCCSGWDCFPRVHVHEYSVSCCHGEALGHMRG